MATSLQDGVDHINVYGRGATALGRALSNFAHTPFTLDGLTFASVEAWWYWQSLVAYGAAGQPLSQLRGLTGLEAKKVGRELHGLKLTIPPTKAALLTAYRAKLAAHPDILAALKASTLPFDHYYEYDGQRRDTHWRWTGLLWNELRSEILGYKVVGIDPAKPGSDITVETTLRRVEDDTTVRFETTSSRVVPGPRKNNPQRTRRGKKDEPK